MFSLCACLLSYERSIDITLSLCHGNTRKVFWCVPYIQQHYSTFHHQLTKLQSSFPPNITIVPVYETLKSSHFLPNKDAVPADLSSCIVYKFLCEHCNKCYIGETARHLVTRASEHMTGRPSQTEVSAHEHAASMKDFSVLMRTRHHKIAESFYIRNYDCQTLLNVQGSSLPLYLYKWHFCCSLLFPFILCDTVVLCTESQWM